MPILDAKLYGLYPVFRTMSQNILINPERMSGDAEPSAFIHHFQNAAQDFLPKA